MTIFENDQCMVFGGYLDIWTADGNFGEIDQIIPILGCTRGTRAADGNFVKMINVWFLADIWIFGQLMVILVK